MFARLFGKRSEDASTEKTKPEEKKEPAKPEPEKAPAPEKAEKEEKAEEKKTKTQEAKPGADSPPAGRPGLLDRLFKKTDKPEEAQPADKKGKPQEKKSASLPYTSSHTVAQLFATVQQQGAPVLAQLSLFRKKTDAEKAQATELESKEAAVKAAKKEAAAKEAAAKAAARELAKREAEVNTAKEKALKEAAKAQKEQEEKKAEQEKARSEEKMEDSTPQEKPAPVKAPEPKTVTRTIMTQLSIEDYAKVLKRPDAQTHLTQMMNSLAALSPRAHPLFRPIITDYIRVLAELASGKAKDTDAKLAKLKKDTEETLAKCKQATVFLDWYQANNPKVKETSQFEEYLNVKEAVKRELKPRTDPITLFFDEWERSQKKKAGR
jgi:hypothetical protein